MDTKSDPSRYIVFIRLSVTRQRSDQLSYVPRLFFNNLVIRHIESSVSQLSLFSLFSTSSTLWTQFWDSVDTTWTPRWTPKPSPQRQDKVYQMKDENWCPLPPLAEQMLCSFGGSRSRTWHLHRH